MWRSTRFFVNMIIKVGKDMLAFLAVFILINLIFTVLNTNLDNSFIELNGSYGLECGENKDENCKKNFMKLIYECDEDDDENEDC